VQHTLKQRIDPSGLVIVARVQFGECLPVLLDLTPQPDGTASQLGDWLGEGQQPCDARATASTLAERGLGQLEHRRGFGQSDEVHRLRRPVAWTSGMRHSPSEAPTTTRKPSGEQSAHSAPEIAFPTLCVRQPALVPALEVVMDAAYREQLLAQSPSHSAAEVETATLHAFGELQALFREQEGEQLEGTWRRELWDAQAQAVFALPGQRGLAKRLQLQASAGRPLTVCFGRRSRPVPLDAPFDKRVFPYGDGCGLVYPDSTGLQRPSFRYYCERCQRRKTELKRRAVAQAVATREGLHSVLVFDETGAAVSGWSGNCRSCGDEFVTTSIRVRRCERCRRGHR